MHVHRDLTQGSILRHLITLALPIMGMSFMQMAYNLTDMIWVGRTGSGAVAAIGTAGFFMWFGFAMLMSTKIGVEVTVSQSLGKKNPHDASRFSHTGYSAAFAIATLYALTILAIAPLLVSFFKLGIDANHFDVSRAAIHYLRLIAVGMPFAYTNQTLSGIFNGYGNTRTPFYIHGVGLLLNCILDPVLIFGIGFIPPMGVIGAAIATVVAQIVVFLLFHRELHRQKHPVRISPDFIFNGLTYLKKIMLIGFPVALQSMLFAFFAMVLARILSSWGPIPIAVQKVGAQIEAISWMTANGFSTALSTFVGQNYGARRYDRIRSGYTSAMIIMSTIGLIATALLYFLSEPIFRIFLQEKEVVVQGIDYLQILALSQLFMCTEITTAGAFNGIGKSIPPAVNSIVFTGLRIPGALLLAYTAGLAVNGVWWSITISSVIKGILIVAWFLLFFKRFSRHNISQNEPVK